MYSENDIRPLRDWIARQAGYRDHLDRVFHHEAKNPPTGKDAFKLIEEEIERGKERVSAELDQVISLILEQKEKVLREFGEK